MTYEEILEKNKILIETNIENCMKEYNLQTEAERHRVAAVYKLNFIKGYKETVEEDEKKAAQARAEIAKDLLSQGIDIEIITQATGLTAEQIDKLEAINHTGSVAKVDSLPPEGGSSSLRLEAD
jgi:hypothetical protein